MAERRQPDYDFFGQGQRSAGGQSQPPQYGAAPPPAGQPPSGTPGGYGTQGPTQSRYGTQLPYGAPAPPSGGGPVSGSPPAWQPPAHPPSPMAVRRSPAVTALIAAAVVVAALFVVGVVAAVAIPVFLNQRVRAEWRATTVALPDTFDGARRLEVAGGAELRQAAPEEAASADLATYVTGSRTTYLVLGVKTKDPMTAEDQTDARREMLAGMSASGVTMDLTEADAGNLGGWFGCGPIEGTPASACVATDSASAVLVVMRGSQDVTGDARRMRETVVRR